MQHRTPSPIRKAVSLEAALPATCSPVFNPDPDYFANLGARSIFDQLLGSEVPEVWRCGCHVRRLCICVQTESSHLCPHPTTVRRRSGRKQQLVAKLAGLSLLQTFMALLLIWFHRIRRIKCGEAEPSCGQCLRGAGFAMATPTKYA